MPAWRAISVAVSPWSPVTTIDTDAGCVAAAHGLRNLATQRVEQRDKADEAQVALDVFPAVEGSLGGQDSAGGAEHPQALRGVAGDRLRHRGGFVPAQRSFASIVGDDAP